MINASSVCAACGRRLCAVLPAGFASAVFAGEALDPAAAQPVRVRRCSEFFGAGATAPAFCS
jgi:hypothetical protein